MQVAEVDSTEKAISRIWDKADKANKWADGSWA